MLNFNERPDKSKKRKFRNIIFTGLTMLGANTPAIAEQTAKNDHSHKPNITEKVKNEVGTKKHIVKTVSGQELELEFSEKTFSNLHSSEKELYELVFSSPEEIELKSQSIKDKYYSIWNMYRESVKGFGYDEIYKSLKVAESDLSRDIIRKKKELRLLSKNDLIAKELIKDDLLKIQSELLKIKNKIETRIVLLKNSIYAERLAILQTTLVRTNEGAKGNKLFKNTISDNILKKSQYSWTNENKYPLVSEKSFTPEKINFEVLKQISGIYETFVENKNNEGAINSIAEELNKRLYENNASEKDLLTLKSVKYSQATSLFEYDSLSESATQIASKSTEISLNKVITNVMGADSSVFIAGGHIFSIER